MKKFKYLIASLLILGGLLFGGCYVLDSSAYSESNGFVSSVTEEIVEEETESSLPEGLPVEGEYYYDVENVVLYLELYHELPLNYITKKEAEKRGWQGGSVEDYVEDAAIGGDHFGNYEGILPEGDYKECDIDTHNYKNRGSRRLIYTDDGKYYYTKNHYESFSEVTVDDNYVVTIRRN